MQVFISWSKQRSHKIAELLHRMLPYFDQAIEPFISSQDLEKGSVWDQELSTKLEGTNFGIICLTRENLREPWILFEAGALFKGRAKNPVCTLLIDIEDAAEVGPPLSKFNHTRVSKDEMLKLVVTLHKHSGSKLPPELISENFKTYWPRFEEAFKACLEATPPGEVPVPRPKQEIDSEILTILRRIDRGIENATRQQALAYLRSDITGMQTAAGYPQLNTGDADSALALLRTGNYSELRATDGIFGRLFSTAVNAEASIDALIAAGAVKKPEAGA